MAKKGYKFTNRIHSKKAIMSAVFGVLSGASLIVLAAGTATCIAIARRRKQHGKG